MKEGDPVAVSFSGSFPALNIAVYAAIRTLNLKPTIISSVSGSQWGANDPAFLWIDMEHFLKAEASSRSAPRPRPWAAGMTRAGG